MYAADLRAGASLSVVYALRMLGLFFILPVFAVHAETLRGGEDLFLVGVAIGGYGLAQGLLQIPFGMASDRWGRKSLIYIGLVVFAAGSFLGIAADDLWTAIAARILPGAGAINSVAMVGAGLPLPEHWKLYLPVVLGSFVLMVPAILYADRRNRPKPVLVTAVALLMAVEGALAAIGPGIAGLAGLMLGFFAAFNVLEAMLPALVSRIAPAHGRGFVIGVYNTTQTLGVFFGGLLGGTIAQHYGPGAVFATCAVLCGLW